MAREMQEKGHKQILDIEEIKFHDIVRMNERAGWCFKGHGNHFPILLGRKEGIAIVQMWKGMTRLNPRKTRAPLFLSKVQRGWGSSHSVLSMNFGPQLACKLPVGSWTVGAVYWNKAWCWKYMLLAKGWKGLQGKGATLQCIEYYGCFEHS